MKKLILAALFFIAASHSILAQKDKLKAYKQPKYATKKKLVEVLPRIGFEVDTIYSTLRKHGNNIDTLDSWVLFTEIREMKIDTIGSSIYMQSEPFDIDSCTRSIHCAWIELDTVTNRIDARIFYKILVK